MFFCLRPFMLDTVLSTLLIQCQLTFENTVKFWILCPFFTDESERSYVTNLVDQAL